MKSSVNQGLIVAYSLMLFARLVAGFPSQRICMNNIPFSLHSSRLFSATSADHHAMTKDFFLAQVETTVAKVLSSFDDNVDVSKLPAPEQREALSVARNLHDRLTNLRLQGRCPRCWLQESNNCICSQVVPIPLKTDRLNKIFLLLHQKEVGLKVDTAKLILAAFPNHCRLVVGGIGPEYQETMKELQEALTDPNTLLLYPDESARTMPEILQEQQPSLSSLLSSSTKVEKQSRGWNVVVLDGTWSQARKLQTRYVPPTVPCVKLTEQAIAQLEGGKGHQLRHHDVTWRQVGTLEATRLFLQDLLGEAADDANAISNQLLPYQEIANEAARRELGPLRFQKAAANIIDGS